MNEDKAAGTGPASEADESTEPSKWWSGSRARKDAREAKDTKESGEDDSLPDRITQQIAAQWALIRAERAAEKADPAPVKGGASDFRKARVPFGVDLAAAWAWRFLVICGALLVILYLLDLFMVVTLPLAIALLLAALASPFVRWLRRLGLSRGVAGLVVLITGIAVVGSALWFVGQQIADGAQDMADSVVRGLEEVRVWLKDGPLNASESQINEYIKHAQDLVTEKSKDGAVVDQVTNVGATLSHLFAGFFIIIFATYFFMADGERIWSWFVRLAPRGAREQIDSSGRVAWVSLTNFVRATVLIAIVDALGIMLVAKILGLPFVLAIGVLVFLGAFVPMVGATVAGGVAVLIALVDQGPWTALWMLLGVIAVQQIEGHGLQPFVMGKLVSIHPLGVIVSIAIGVLVAGVPGALIAVPLVAVVNAVALHLANEGTAQDPAVELGMEDADPPGGRNGDPVPATAHTRHDVDPTSDGVEPIDPRD